MMDKWEQLVGDMDIPITRKIDLPDNLRWFIRNGGINNRRHENFDAALAYAKKQTRYGSFDDTYN